MFLQDLCIGMCIKYNTHQKYTLHMQQGYPCFSGMIYMSSTEGHYPVLQVAVVVLVQGYTTSGSPT